MGPTHRSIAGLHGAYYYYNNHETSGFILKIVYTVLFDGVCADLRFR